MSTPCRHDLPEDVLPGCEKDIIKKERAHQRAERGQILIQPDCVIEPAQGTGGGVDAGPSAPLAQDIVEGLQDARLAPPQRFEADPASIPQVAGLVIPHGIPQAPRNAHDLIEAITVRPQRFARGAVQPILDIALQGSRRLELGRDPRCRIKIITYTISGFLAAVAGFLLASWQMAITSNQGSSYLLYAIAAPIIGGVSVFGGRGNVRGVLGGVLLLTVIQVGLAIINVPSFYVGMIGGVMIFIAVAIDAVRVRYFG